MSGTASLRVVTADPTPVYEQLRRQLVELILAGVIGAGDRLPPLRQVASDLGLAVGTVARTYRELEAAGLVESRRGGGTRVRARPGAEAAQRQAALRAQAEAFVHRARLLGADDSQIRGALHDALAEGAGSASTTRSAPVPEAAAR